MMPLRGNTTRLLHWREVERHRATTRHRILRVDQGAVTPTVDWLLGEEPLAIRIKPLGGAEELVTTTLRTPGDDFALAVGLLASEAGLTRDDLLQVRYCGTCDSPREYNTVTVSTRRALALQSQTSIRTSSCGWCGAEELGARLQALRGYAASRQVAALDLTSAIAELVEHQHRFVRTGACHAALVMLPDGSHFFGEDVGRHNALDKAIGHAVLDGAPLTGALVALSGRVGGDLVTKAARVGATHIVAVSAPSALAVALADASGLTLAAFCRGGRFNLYTHPEGVDLLTRGPSTCDAMPARSNAEPASL